MPSPVPAHTTVAVAVNFVVTVAIAVTVAVAVAIPIAYTIPVAVAYTIAVPVAVAIAPHKSHKLVYKIYNVSQRNVLLLVQLKCYV